MESQNHIHLPGHPRAAKNTIHAKVSRKLSAQEGHTNLERKETRKCHVLLKLIVKQVVLHHDSSHEAKHEGRLY